VGALLAVGVGHRNLVRVETEIVDERGIVVHSTVYSGTTKGLVVGDRPGVVSASIICFDN
jgi:hypothetical protein